MIVYQSNKNFLRDLSQFKRSFTMRRIIRAVLAIGLISAAFCIPLIHFELEQHFSVERDLFSFIGIVLSILLVFRTNTAYDRWWEGRKQWGALVNHCRNLAIQLHVTLPADHQKSRKRLARNIANFCIALKEHLREGVILDELEELSPEEVLRYQAYAHIPNYLSRLIQEEVQQAYRAGLISGFDHVNIKVHTQALLDILGACERIKKTPIPFSYAVYLKGFVLVYSVLLPFALVAELGYAAIPLTMLVLFAFLGVELMAEEIEDPFGLDCNDLPTGTIAHTIRNNVYEIFELHFTPVDTQAAEYEKIF